MNWFLLQVSFWIKKNNFSYNIIVMMMFTFEGVNEGEKIVIKDLLKIKITKAD